MSIFKITLLNAVFHQRLREMASNGLLRNTLLQTCGMIVTGRPVIKCSFEDPPLVVRQRNWLLFYHQTKVIPYLYIIEYAGFLLLYG